MADQDPPLNEPRSSVLPPVSLATIASVVLGVSALVAGLAVLAGWQYTRKYYAEFGIHSSALDFSPYEYAVRSRLALDSAFVLLVAAVICLTIAYTIRRVPQTHSIPRTLDRLIPPPQTTKEINIATILMIAFFVAVAIFDRVAGGESYIWYIGLAFLLGIATIAVLIVRARRTEYAVLLAGAVLLALLFVFLQLPSTQAQIDARRDREQPEHFPVVSIVSKRELGLDHQETEAGLFVYGPYRLILCNGGMYYIVSEEDPNRTIAVPQDSVIHLELRHGN